MEELEAKLERKRLEIQELKRSYTELNNGRNYSHPHSRVTSESYEHLQPTRTQEVIPDQHHDSDQTVYEEYDVEVPVETIVERVVHVPEYRYVEEVTERIVEVPVERVITKVIWVDDVKIVEEPEIVKVIKRVERIEYVPEAYEHVIGTIEPQVTKEVLEAQTQLEEQVSVKTHSVEVESKVSTPVLTETRVSKPTRVQRFRPLKSVFTNTKYAELFPSATGTLCELPRRMKMKHLAEYTRFETHLPLASVDITRFWKWLHGTDVGKASSSRFDLESSRHTAQALV